MKVTNPDLNIPKHQYAIGDLDASYWHQTVAVPSLLDTYTHSEANGVIQVFNKGKWPVGCSRFGSLVNNVAIIYTCGALNKTGDVKIEWTHHSTLCSDAITENWSQVVVTADGIIYDSGLIHFGLIDTVDITFSTTIVGAFFINGSNLNVQTTNLGGGDNGTTAGGGINVKVTYPTYFN